MSTVAHDGEIGRLLVYVDVPYYKDEEGYSVDRAFLIFVFELARHVKTLALVGRVRPGRGAYAVPEHIEIVALPDYRTLRHVFETARAAPRTVAVLSQAVGRADSVLSIGPHPFSLPLAMWALIRRKKLVLMVRQNYVEYIRHRLPSGAWRLFVAVAAGSEVMFQIMSRAVGIIVVGNEMAEKYARAKRVLNVTISLMPAAEFATAESRAELRDPVRLLAVTRLDPEKAPETLIHAVSLAQEQLPDHELHLTVVGDGPVRNDILKLADEILPKRVTFEGYVPHGRELFDVFRRHDIFLHAARTEGIPQAIVEAQFIGVPVVGTDVGGVRAATDGGATALLVRPSDPAAMAAAIVRLVVDTELRSRLVSDALKASERLTLERQVERVATFIAAADHRL